MISMITLKTNRIKMDFVIQVTFIAASWITVSAGAIQCYCSLPECSSSGFLCTSHLGKCFSQLGYEPGKAMSRHGCMEMLQVKDRHVCEAQGDIIKTNNLAKGDNQSELPFLMCCKEQMCNYMDTIDVEILVDTSNDTKDSIQSSSDPQARQELSQEHRWFKAAVIAVPIAGALILVILVIVAVKMLRQDTRHHAQSLAKAQLYVDEHFYVENTPNIKYEGSLINHPQYSGTAVHPQIYYPQHAVQHHHAAVDYDYRDHRCYKDHVHSQYRESTPLHAGYEQINNDCSCTSSSDTGSTSDAISVPSCVVVSSEHANQAGGTGTRV